jgi:Holliday junction resolvase RusA-like endonuclease
MGVEFYNGQGWTRNHPTKWSWGRRRGRVWTDAEHVEAKFMSEQLGLGNTEIAQVLKRSEQSVRHKLGKNQKPERQRMIELYFSDYPPSVNALWGYGRGRVFKSKAYVAWLEYAGLLLNTQHPGSIIGPYKLWLQVRGDGTKADVDNLIKPVNDLLQSSGVIQNDRLCCQASIRRVTSGYDGLYVRVEPAGVET